ncbi:MAG TPA: phosphoribosylamine--glycine ligase [Nitrospirota bacterium]|nr:phosphoribosylamine--glycine ligase [Nitrospirota bacterium]
MNVLVIGSGGREHALVWKIAQSRHADRIYCAPGNAGIAGIAECIPISATDIEALYSFAMENDIGLTIVGPEAPLVLGIVDTFRKGGLRIFGPLSFAAQLEGSKSFSKRIMLKYGIPTADARVFSDYEKAVNYIREKGVPIVVKADGLAAGKGVMVCTTEGEAIKAVNMIMSERLFGDAGAQVVVEECLKGEEASFLVFSDGNTIIPMPPSQDHKRALDNDCGPNTGGMGAYTPVPIIDMDMQNRIMKEVMLPAVNALKAEGCPYEGILYAGIMLTTEGPKVLEFNCRFGDPEAQPILMRLQTDILDIMNAVIDKKLDSIEIEWSDKASVCVVIASGGYPDKYTTGQSIKGLKDFNNMNDVVVFHAGTKFDGGNIVTAGGRVLGVTAIGVDLKNAIDKAYDELNRISFEGMQYRKDIGRRGISN